MRDKVGAGVILIGALIVQRPVRQRSCTDILLAAENEVVHSRLRVFFVRILNPAGTRKKVDHVWGQMKRSSGGGLVEIVKNVVVDRFVAVVVGYLSPGTDSKGDQIGAVRKVFYPIVGRL